jgi:hypothetical protein
LHGIISGRFRSPLEAIRLQKSPRSHQAPQHHLQVKINNEFKKKITKINIENKNEHKHVYL